MSKREKRRRESAPMPAAGAGLLRFFEDEAHGIKIKPELIVVLAVALIVVCIFAQAFL